MSMSRFLAEVTADDLPNDDLQFLSNVIGIENVRKLMERCPGMHFYVPAKMQSEFYMRYIERHYKPQSPNARELALALGITQQTVYRMLREIMPRRVA